MLGIWNAVTGERSLSLEGHTGQVRGVAFSPDGKLLATVAGPGTARLWDAASGELVGMVLADELAIGALDFRGAGIGGYTERGVGIGQPIPGRW